MITRDRLNVLAEIDRWDLTDIEVSDMLNICRAAIAWKEHIDKTMKRYQGAKATIQYGVLVAILNGKGPDKQGAK